MSDEDTELRDLVTQTLETNGILGKIKAQLRANIYLALDDGNELKSKSKEFNKTLDEFLEASDGRLVFHLFREFLDFFNLKYTLSVFEAEVSGIQGVSPKTRSQLINGLGLAELVDPKTPIVSEIIRLSKVSVLKSETPTSTELTNRTEDNSSLHSSLDDESVTQKSSSVGRVRSTHSPQPPSDVSTTGSTPINSLTSINKRQEQTTQETSLKSKEKTNEKSMDSTFTLDKTDPFRHVDPFAKPMSQSSFLGDLPPLDSKKPSAAGIGLAPLKKIPKNNSNKEAAGDKRDPPATKPPEAVAKSLAEAPKPLQTKPPSAKVFEADSQPPSLSVEEEIDEDIEEFLNSSVSATEDFTKDESASELKSLKADYVESI